MLKQIEKRRSCRAYDPDRMVEEEKIQEVINAGLHAATGMGTQNGIIIAITNKEVRNKLMELNKTIFNRDSDPFYGAPVILLVAVMNCAFNKYDGACMIENMLVEATNQGLGSCWIHRAKEELELKEGRDIFISLGLNLEMYEGVGHVILGYPLENAYREKTIKENRVFWIK